MAHYEITTGLTDARVLTIKNLIAQLKAELSFTIKLTPEERVALPSVDQGRLPYVELGAEYARDYHADLMIDAQELAHITTINYDFTALSDILTGLESITEATRDTKMAVGSNCYVAAGVVRDLIQVAVRRRKPGMETLWDEMSKLYERDNRARSGGGEPEAPVQP